MKQTLIAILVMMCSLFSCTSGYADGEYQGIIPGKLAWFMDSIVEQWNQTDDINSETIEQTLYSRFGKKDNNSNSASVEERYNRQLVITLGFVNLGSETYRFDNSSRLEASITRNNKTVRVDAVPTINKTVIAPNGRVKKCTFILKMNNRTFNEAFNQLDNVADFSINPLSGKLLIEDAKGNSLLDSVPNPAKVSIQTPLYLVKFYVFPESESSLTLKDALLLINKTNVLFAGNEEPDTPDFSIEDDQIESIIGVPNNNNYKIGSNVDLGWILLFMFNDKPVNNDKTADILKKQLNSKDEFKVAIVPVETLNEYFPLDDTRLLVTFRKCIEKLPESVAPKRYQEVNIKCFDELTNPFAPLKEYAESGDNEAIEVIFNLYSPKKASAFLTELFPDPNSFFHWLKKLADKGYAQAQFNVAFFYEDGILVEADIDKAIKYYKMAADQDKVAAMVGYANALYQKNKEKYQDEVVEWLRKAAERKDPRGQYLLALMLLKSQDKEQNQEGILWLQQSAFQGEPDAMFAMALEYLFGRYIPKDDKKAFTLMEQAALDKGYTKAIDVLGDFYMRGIGVERDGKLAAICYSVGAENGIPNSMYWYGRFLCDGFNVEKDVKKGYDLIKEAAAMGKTDAMLFLGLDFYTGEIAKKNHKEAFVWIEKAANNGDISAIAVLGDFYMEGVGVKANKEKAVELYKKSASVKDPYGVFRLGQTLYEQKGADAKTGLGLIKVAAKMGNKSAQEYLDNLDVDADDEDDLDSDPNDDVDDLDDEDDVDPFA